MAIVRQSTNTDCHITAHLPNICLVVVEKFKDLTKAQLSGGKWSKLSPSRLKSTSVLTSNNDQVKFV